MFRVSLGPIFHRLQFSIIVHPQLEAGPNFGYYEGTRFPTTSSTTTPFGCDWGGRKGYKGVRCVGLIGSPEKSDGVYRIAPYWLHGGPLKNGKTLKFEAPGMATNTGLYGPKQSCSGFDGKIPNGWGYYKYPAGHDCRLIKPPNFSELRDAAEKGTSDVWTSRSGAVTVLLRGGNFVRIIIVHLS